MPGEVTLAHQVGKDFSASYWGSQVAYVLVEATPTNGSPGAYATEFCPGT